jgi:hypothetical protein
VCQCSVTLAKCLGLKGSGEWVVVSY